MKRIGLILPFFLLIVFALVFHPTMKIHLMAFTNPGQYVFFSPQMFFLLATALVCLKNRLHPKDIGLNLQPLKRNLILGLVGGLLPYLALTAINLLLSIIFPSDGNNMNYGMSPWMLFSFLILAPITEELFFRGVLFHALQQHHSLFVSMLTSTLIFSAAHSTIMIGPLLLGVITAWMTYRTKSIFPGMIFHSLSNGIPWFYTNFCQHLHPFEGIIFFRF